MSWKLEQRPGRKMGEPSLQASFKKPKVCTEISWIIWILHGFATIYLTLKSCFKNKPMCYPQQLFKILECFCTGTLWNFVCYVYRNLPEPHPLSAQQPSEPHQLSGPEPAGTASAICTGTIRNHPEPCLLSTPEPSGTSSAICTGTVRNLISFLHRNPPEPHQLSAPEPSGTFSGTWGCSCTGSHQSYSGLKTP